MNAIALVDLVLSMDNSRERDIAGEVIIVGFNTFLGFEILVCIP